MLWLTLAAVACSGVDSTGDQADGVASSSSSTATPLPTTSSTAATASVPGGISTDATVEHLEIKSVRLPGRLWDPFLPPIGDGSDVSIEAWLRSPPGMDPAPAVILVHGCGGLGVAERDWAVDLASEGIATVTVDSFGGRGVGEICSARETLNVADLIVDVYRTAETLRADPRIDGDRIAVLGFSFGGRTALWSALTRFQETYDGRPLAAYIAFYPSTCFIQLEAESEVTGGPIRIFHGTADDWTPMEPCQEFVDRLEVAGVDAALFSYPGARHGFDIRSLAWGGNHYSPSLVSPRACSFVERDGVITDPDTGVVAGVGSPCVERGASFGYNEAAREKAEDDLFRLLDEVFR